MMLLHAGRVAGKTTQAMAWVSNGVPTTGWVCTRPEHLNYGLPVEPDEREVCEAVERRGSYPGWTRVLVVCHLSEFERLKKEYWSRLEDFDHRVYPIEEWLSAHNVNPSTEVCIDNLELILHGGWRHFPGWIAAATINAKPWEPQTFKESAPDGDVQARGD